MKCPVDRVELIEQLVGSTGFALCPNCSGLWLPRSARMELVDPDRIASAKRRVPEESRRPRKYRACPRCRIAMTAQHLDGVEVDRCMTCDGIWLDAGEYEAVRHRFATDAHSDLSVQKRGFLGSDGPAELLFDLVSLLLEFWH